MKIPAHRRNIHKYCKYHQDVCHSTNDCLALKDFNEKLIASGCYKYIAIISKHFFEQDQATDITTFRRIVTINIITWTGPDPSSNIELQSQRYGDCKSLLQ